MYASTAPRRGHKAAVSDLDEFFGVVLLFVLAIVIIALCYGAALLTTATLGFHHGSPWTFLAGGALIYGGFALMVSEQWTNAKEWRGLLLALTGSVMMYADIGFALIAFCQNYHIGT